VAEREIRIKLGAGGELLLGENARIFIVEGSHPGESVPLTEGVHPGESVQPIEGVHPGESVQPTEGVHPGESVDPGEASVSSGKPVMRVRMDQDANGPFLRLFIEE